jgi:hypothetical protein
VIVTIALVSHLSRRTSPGDVIWAKIFHQIEQSTGCTARGKFIQDGEQYDVYVYESPQFGHKQEVFKRGALIHQSFMSNDWRAVTLVSHEDSTYFQYEFSGSVVDIFRKFSVFTLVSRMKGRPHADLGITNTEGTVTSGIQVVDTVTSRDTRQFTTTRLYVDVDTQWPVRLEADRNSGTAAPAFDIVMYEFDWYPSFESSDFEVTIPEGFTPVRPTRESGN